MPQAQRVSELMHERACDEIPPLRLERSAVLSCRRRCEVFELSDVRLMNTQAHEKSFPGSSPRPDEPMRSA